MPAALSHHLFAKDCAARVPEAEPAFLDALYAGAQGPDPLFFLGYIPWRARRRVAEIRAFGSLLHAIDPRKLYLACAREALSVPADRRVSALGFAAGLVLHFILDERIHPFVYEATGTDMVAHHRFEANLAAWMAASSEPVGKRWLARDPASIEQADRICAAACAGFLLPGEFRDSWTDMTEALRALQDPWGLKFALLRTIPSAVRPGSLPATLRFFGSLIIPVRADPAGIPENIGRSIAQATERGVQVLAAASAMLAGTEGPEAWSGAFDGLNHDGKPAKPSPPALPCCITA